MGCTSSNSKDSTNPPHHEVVVKVKKAEENTLIYHNLSNTPNAQISNPQIKKTNSTESTNSSSKKPDLIPTGSNHSLDLKHEEFDYEGVKLSGVLMCRDKFVSKHTGVTMYKWRKVMIVQIEGIHKDKILVHFIGWADTFDEWIDLNKDITKICPEGLLKKEEADKGVELTTNQLEITKQYLITGFLEDSESFQKSSNNSVGLKRTQSEKKVLDPLDFSVGNMLDVLDIYYKKGVDIPQYKWRKAKVVEKVGNKIRINYIGWDTKYDENLDLTKDAERISEFGSKSSEQTSMNVVTKSPNRRKTFDSDSSKFLNPFRSSTISETVNKVLTSSSKQLSGSGSNNKISSKENITTDISDEEVKKIEIEMQNSINKEKEFISKLEPKALHVIDIEGDGNCLFRSISHQLFLNEEHHEELRAKCVEHLIIHRKRFEAFFTGDFDEYVKEMSKPGTWGDDIEIRALEEIIDRNIRIYSSSSEDACIPINNNFDEEIIMKGVVPLNVSYHGQSHYNSIYDEKSPLPLSIRHSRVLLNARIALFEGRPILPFYVPPTNSNSSTATLPTLQNASVMPTNIPQNTFSQPNQMYNPGMNIYNQTQIPYQPHFALQPGRPMPGIYSTRDPRDPQLSQPHSQSYRY